MFCPGCLWHKQGIRGNCEARRRPNPPFSAAVLRTFIVRWTFSVAAQRLFTRRQALNAP